MADIVEDTLLEMSKYEFLEPEEELIQCSQISDSTQYPEFSDISSSEEESIVASCQAVESNYEQLKNKGKDFFAKFCHFDNLLLKWVWDFMYYYTPDQRSR